MPILFEMTACVCMSVCALSSQSSIRNVVMSVESRAQQELDEKNAALAEKVESAKLEQLQGQFAQDLETLKKRMATPESEAIEAAKDKFFLRERQRTDCICSSRLPFYRQGLCGTHFYF